MADEAIFVILGIAGLHGALSEQRYRPVLIALVAVCGGLVEQ